MAVGAQRDDRTGPHGALVTPRSLAAHLGDPSLRIVDVRWTLGRPGAGRAAWESARIPGAVHLDIDADLSAIGDPRLGRHPLPDPQRLVLTLARHGIGRGHFVVAYDEAGGAHAARLWWLLRWIGVEAAVLDGGLPAWRLAGLPIESGPPPAVAEASEPFDAAARADLVVHKDHVRRVVERRASDPSARPLLLDARAPERFRGEVEPIDPRPGHIPTALSAPTAANLASDGSFLDPARLRAHFAALGIARGDEVIAYCGSGVTACHDLLALEIAGLRGARLYDGSYSEWSRDPSLPVDKG